jgi:hypothetical protein
VAPPPSDTTASLAEGRTVRGLSAGGRWIRPIGPAEGTWCCREYRFSSEPVGSSARWRGIASRGDIIHSRNLRRVTRYRGFESAFSSSELAANRDADEGGTEPAWAAHGQIRRRQRVCPARQGNRARRRPAWSRPTPASLRRAELSHGRSYRAGFPSCAFCCRRRVYAGIAARADRMPRQAPAWCDVRWLLDEIGERFRIFTLHALV